ncbi:MAG: tetratricopeptide repeat protein [candidate division Zixibacteria bacterium]|nr:tetratricopeptide repeat protein [candidate division Zixibacteria bacterium]
MTEGRKLKKPSGEVQYQLSTDPRFQLARRLMSSRDFQAAADVLETLYEIDPDNSVITNSLKSCYEHLKQYSKGELLLRRLLEKFPGNVSYQLNLAESLIGQGKLDEGKKIYKDLLSQVDPKRPGAPASVIRSMVQANLEEDALEAILNLRKISNDSTVMAMERAGILKGRGAYKEACQEYFKIIRDSSRFAAKAEKGISELLSFGESARIAEEALVGFSHVDTSGRVFRLLSAYYLKTERFDDAYHFALKQDSAENFRGASIMQYLRETMERELYPQAIRMCEHVVKDIANKPFKGEFYFKYAKALEETAEHAAAIAIYDTIAATFPRAQDKGEATYRIGSIYLNRTNQPDLALIYFDSVITHYFAGQFYTEATLGIPKAYMKMGDLENARKEYAELEALRRNSRISELVIYNLALISFYDKKYDSASALLNELIVKHPKGLYVNDAIKLLLLIDRAENATELLDYFAGAYLFEEMNRPDSAVYRLTSAVNARNKALADMALFQITEIVLENGDEKKAVSYVDRLAKEFPESYYLPFGLKIKADILFDSDDSIDSRDEAKQIYKTLLESYPNYPFINKVRQILREAESVSAPS